MAIPIELQGEGSYDYKCREQDCLFCRTMVVINAQPVVPELQVETIETFTEPKITIKKRSKGIIKQTPWPKYRAATTVKGGRGDRN